ncbi:MAG: uroporphyrinogen decarboxylase family protein [Planctomycetota bacterium]|jgi:uroporphyrinogen decarboxylase
MDAKERFLTAMAGGTPDHVPCSPDMSNMMPAKRTGLPFWDIYFFDQKPLWQAYLENAEYFGIDGWVGSCCGAPLLYADADVETESQDEYDEKDDRYIRTTVTRSNQGALTSRQICPRFDPPSPVEKPIKDLKRDLPTYLSFRSEVTGVYKGLWNEMRAESEKRNFAFGVGVGYPGFHAWSGATDGGVMPLAVAEMEEPELLEMWHEHDLESGTRALEFILAEKPDYVGLGGSGTITLASPDLARKYCLPAIKLWSAMCREAGIPTVLHSCGRSRELVHMLAEETDVSCINPLEIPPMGDVILSEVKEAHGSQIALMGNLHTTDVMLNGTADEVRAASHQAIDDAGKGGGFILSTGDQCGMNTPEENIFAMVEVAKEYGRY